MRISVLIDSCNNHEFIESTVDSVLRQTQAADEIIVSDDGSTDETCALIRRRFADRVTIAGHARLPGETHLARQAASIARAFLHSTGELVFLLDGDDVFLPQRIERYAAVMQANPDVVMVQSPLQHIDAAGNPLPSFCPDFPASDDLLPEAYRQHDLNCFYSTSALAFRRSFLERTLPLDVSDGLEVWTDNRLCIAALLAGRVVTLADASGCWRRHTGSVTLSLFKQRTYLARLSLARIRHFNRCRQGMPLKPLQPWRSCRFYLRWIRSMTPFPRRYRDGLDPGQQSTAAAPAAQPRALIVDDRLRDRRGHQFGFVTGMASWLARHGMQVEVFAHREFPGTLEVPGARVCRIFSVSWYETFVRASPRTRIFAVLTHNGRFLWQLLRAKNARSYSLAIATEASVMHLLAWRFWLALTPRQSRLLLVFIHPLWMLEYSPADGSPRPKFQARLYRWSLSLMAGSLRSGRCRLAADSEAVAAFLRHGRKWHVADVVVPGSAEQLARCAAPLARPQEALRLGILGRSVRERGFDRALAAIEAWCRRENPPARPVRFVVQWFPALSARDEDYRTLQQLVRHFPEVVECMPTDLDLDAYCALLSSLHGGIIVHNRSAYADRPSNIVMEMLCTGLPFVTTAGTWMEQEMKSRGAGVACAESPANILGAIDVLAADYEKLSAQALARRTAAREHYSWARFFDLTGISPEQPARSAAATLDDRRNNAGPATGPT